MAEVKKKFVMPKLINHKNDVQILKDIVIPDKFFNRMCMGVQVLDELFGGQDWPGILPGASVLFTGMPGAGKSTAALQFADLLQRNSGRNILYNVGEESEFMVASRARRLGIKADFGISTIDDVDDLIAKSKETGVEVLFQDSLQSLTCKEAEHASRQERMKIVTKKLHKFAKDESIAIFIIGHITKGGDFAGPMEIKHDIDVHAHIKLNPETMAREFSLTKNRWGPAGIPYECNLTQTGLDFAELKLIENKPGEESEKKGGRAGERREAVMKVIKDALLSGDKVSAYCVSRLKDPFSNKVGVDCSGGFWRSMLEKVVQQLKSEGTNVGQVKIDNRTHYVIESI